MTAWVSRFQDTRIVPKATSTNIGTIGGSVVAIDVAAVNTNATPAISHMALVGFKEQYSC
jgi:hypothetical protein